MTRNRIRRLAFAVAGVVALTACGNATGESGPEVAGQATAAATASDDGSPQTEEPTDDGEGSDPATESDDADAAADSEDGSEASTLPAADDQGDDTAAPRAVPDGESLYAEVDGQRTLVHAYDHPESEAGFVEAALRPGATATDGLAVATVVSEGYRMVRWFHYADGEPAGHGELSDPFRPEPDMYAASEVMPTLVWSSDGSHFAWIDWDHTGEDVRLNLQSWDREGPGTGATYDGSGFALDLAPGWTLTGWVDTETGATLHAEGPDGGTTTIELEGDSRSGYAPAG